ncbi:MAG: aminodeoxyfutalosine deaminase [Verrucomicrobiota bacterium]|jgi:cytosine/adenosine deaminase-related metal-dependent hydrolase
MIIRARTVVSMEGEPIDDGAVAVSGSTIADVGRFDEVRERQAGEVLDLGEQVLLPGLINGHCHLDYTMLRGAIAPQRSFSGWIQAINTEKAKLTERDYIDSIHAGFAEARSFGTTTILNLIALPKLVAAIKDQRIRTWWFGELIDVRTPDGAERLAEEAAEFLKAAGRWGLAPHAPFTASPRLYARCKEIARRENVPLTTHLAESHEEMEMFRDASGAAFDFLKEIGRPMNDCGRETPLSLFLRTRTIDQRWIVAHLNELDAGDFDLLSAAPKFHIVHCPRSHTFLRHAPFALERLRALGFNICLGTDSLASNSDLSLFAELRELLHNEPWLSPREGLEMATINGAAAIGQRNALGCIRAGAQADLIALPLRRSADVFESIVGYDEAVSWMMVDGKITVPL